MHWLGPYQVRHVTEGGVASLARLDGTMLPTMVNGSRLKLYRDNPPNFSTKARGIGVQMSSVLERDITHIKSLHNAGLGRQCTIIVRLWSNCQIDGCCEVKTSSMQ